MLRCAPKGPGSVKVLLPISRDAAARTRCRLVERMVVGGSERRAFTEVLSGKVPKPLLAWFEALDHRMARSPRVRGRVLRW